MSFFKNLFKAVVVAAAVATGIAYFLPALIPAGISASLYIAGAAAMAAATYTVSTLLAGTPPKFDLSQQIRGQLVTTRSPNESTRVVYGQTRLGGPILFVETTGEKNETLFMVIGIAGHACFPAGHNLETVFVNDEAFQITYVGNVGSINYKNSTTAITLEKTFPASLLAGTAASSYTFQGLQAIAVKLVFNPDLFPSGLPNITFETYGKTVFDPRTSTTAYSENAALAIRDYLLNTDFGLGVTANEIDDESFEEAADDCDEQVPVKPYAIDQGLVSVIDGDRIEFNGHYLYHASATIAVTGILTGTATGISTGVFFVRNAAIRYKRFAVTPIAVGTRFQISATADGPIITLGAGSTTGLTFEYSSLTESRYTINGAFQTSEQPQDILSKMLTSCGGKLNYQGGKWVLKVAKFYSPTITLTEDDVVGQIAVQASQSRRDIFNAVKGLYSEPAESYQPFSFPPVTNATYEAQDGERIFKDVQFPFTTSFATCQRLSKIDLEKSRQQIAVNVSCNIKNAFALAPGDVVNLTFERYGFSAKPFEVLTWEFSFADGDSGLTPIVNLTLRETASNIYTWSLLETQIDLALNTNLPDPFTVNPPVLSISDTLSINAEQVITKLVIELAGENTFQDFYEVQVKLSTDSTFINLGEATGNIFEFVGAEDGRVYNVRARSVNALGVRSAFAQASHQVVGKIAPPADVTDLSMNIIGTEAHFSWTPVPDLDLSHYKIRHSRLTSGATYAEAVDLILKISRPGVTAIAPAMTGTYFIKAVDKLNHASVNAAEVVAIIESIKGLNVIQLLTESPTFAGNKVECHVADNFLVLDTATDFDDLPGLFDDVEGFFDGGGGTVSTTGTYDFAQELDLGAVFTSRVTAFVEVGRIDYVDNFDSAGGLFDSREGAFDGDPNQFDDTNVELQVAVTNDDPAISPTYSAFRKFFVGDYKARGFRFRAVLTSKDAQASPSVSLLAVEVDMPDRVTSGDDIASTTAAGGKVVNFVPAFKQAPALGIAAQNLASGDFYEILSKSPSSFTIRFKNSGGAVVDRTFDFTAAGFGELAA